MTQLKSKAGTKLFSAVVEAEGVTLHQEGDKIVAKLDGVTVGTVRVPKVKAKGKEISVSALIPEIDVASLIGKDPTTLSKEELVALTLHLQSGAQAAAISTEDEEEDEAPKAKSKPAKTKKASAPVEDEDEDEEDEENGFELPEKYDTYEKIAALGVKAMWSEIGKHIAAEAGIKARMLKDDMLEAITEYFELEPEEDEEEAPKAKSKSSKGKNPSAPVEDDEDDEDEDEDDMDDEDEDEDDFDEDEDEDDIDEDEDDEDDEDLDDEDEDEDDEDLDDEDEDEDEDDEDDEDEDDDEITEEDIDALFETGDKKVIVKFCKEHDITLPQRKLNAQTLKKIIKDAIFGEE